MNRNQRPPYSKQENSKQAGNRREIKSSPPIRHTHEGRALLPHLDSISSGTCRAVSNSAKAPPAARMSPLVSVLAVMQHVRSAFGQCMACPQELKEIKAFNSSAYWCVWSRGSNRRALPRGWSRIGLTCTDWAREFFISNTPSPSHQ